MDFWQGAINPYRLKGAVTTASARNAREGVSRSEMISRETVLEGEADLSATAGLESCAPITAWPRAGEGRRLAQRDVESDRCPHTKNVAERVFRGGLLVSHPDASTTPAAAC
jgi:hypothetical protein